MICDVEIREPYYTAGKKYSWLNEHKQIGIGINKILLVGEGDLTMKHGKYEYKINKEKARSLWTKYNSTFKRGNTTICVLPFDSFTRIQ